MKDSFDLAAYVKKSTRKSGVPLVVTDLGILRAVAHRLLRRPVQASKPRSRAN